MYQKKQMYQKPNVLKQFLLNALINRFGLDLARTMNFVERKSEPVDISFLLVYMVKHVQRQYCDIFKEVAHPDQ